MTKRRVQTKNKVIPVSTTAVTGKVSKKRKVLSELNIESRTERPETRAAKRQRLNNAENEPSSTISIKSDLKIEQNVDEIDKASADDATDVKLYIDTSRSLKISDDLCKSAIEILNMKSLMTTFAGNNHDQFFDHCRQFVNSSTMSSAEILTIEQADTPLWFEMRYGRITASRIYQASRCKTKNGSLVDSIMGKRSGWSFAMQRGTNLEDQVFNILKDEMKIQGHALKQCGLI